MTNLTRTFMWPMFAGFLASCGGEDPARDAQHDSSTGGTDPMQSTGGEESGTGGRPEMNGPGGEDNAGGASDGGSSGEGNSSGGAESGGTDFGGATADGGLPGSGGDSSGGAESGGAVGSGGESSGGADSGGSEGSGGNSSGGTNGAGGGEPACDGCWDSEGVCQPGDAPRACGKGGGQCELCNIACTGNQDFCSPGEILFEQVVCRVTETQVNGETIAHAACNNSTRQNLCCTTLESFPNPGWCTANVCE